MARGAYIEELDLDGSHWSNISCRVTVFGILQKTIGPMTCV